MPTFGQDPDTFKGKGVSHIYDPATGRIVAILINSEGKKVRKRRSIKQSDHKPCTCKEVKQYERP